MGITIRKKRLKKERFSLYLDIIINRLRLYEFLGIFLIPEKNQADKEYNKEQMKIAELIKAKKEIEILEGKYELNLIKYNQIEFFQVAERIIADYMLSTRSYIAVVKKFKEFIGREVWYMDQFNEQLLFDFYEFLLKKLNNETPNCYIKKFKKLIRDIYNKKLIKQNYASNIRCRRTITKQKDILSPEELRKLFRTQCPNLEVKVAFLFACYSGLRWCDIKLLRGNNINANTLQVCQQKTKQTVTVILNSNAQKLIAHRINGDKPIFYLCSHTGALKNLRVWVKNANINKKITFHCSRHIFSCNLLAAGVDLYTTSNLLGHSNTKYVGKYLRENNELKERGVNNLAKLF